MLKDVRNPSLIRVTEIWFIEEEEKKRPHTHLLVSMNQEDAEAASPFKQLDLTDTAMFYNKTH